MPIGSIISNSPRGLQLSPGTHGLYSDANTSTLIGKLIIADGRETWIFKSSNDFPGTFYLKGQSQPAKSVQGATVYEYQDKVIRGTSSSQTIKASGTTLFEIKKSNSTVGYLDSSSTKGNTLTWYFGSIDENSGRYAIAKDEVLTFSTTKSDVTYTCYKSDAIDRLDSP